ncbi:MAG: hypothetical protein IPP32_17710 [Bacteroidetes bacterium]|nr:hypothetical protein [Bacteroidota bacterium]
MKTNRPLIIATFVLLLSSGNFSRLSGTECVRPVVMITLLTMGAAVAIIFQELIKRYKEKQ